MYETRAVTRYWIQVDCSAGDDFLFKRIEDKQANSGCECSNTGETQDARCAKVLHELILEDDEGLHCIYCHNVELEPRDVLPKFLFYQILNADHVSIVSL